MTKRELQDKRLALETQERAECAEIHKRYRPLWNELHQMCIAEGLHNPIACGGDLAGPNLAGHWPFSCFNCGRLEYK